MRLLDRYKIEVAINEVVGANDFDDGYDDPILARIKNENRKEEYDQSWIFDVRDIWDMSIERKKGLSTPVRVFAYLESGVTLDVCLDDAEELLEIWRKRTYKRK